MTRTSCANTSCNFFQTEDTYEPYAEYVDDRWLKDVFAETKILAGLGEQEKWYSLLDNPTKYQQLKERVDLRFAPQNKEFFGSNDAGDAGAGYQERQER